MSSLGNVLFPLAVLTAAGGAAVQIAIKFLILQGKAFPLLEKHEEDFIQKVPSFSLIIALSSFCHCFTYNC